MPSFKLDATETTITFDVTTKDGYTYYRLFLRESTETTNMILDGLVMADKFGRFTYTVYGLTPGTEYAANVYYSTDETTMENYIIGTQYIKTLERSRPNDWSWSTNIVKGATVPKYGESLAPITAAEWNAFCERINAFRVYKSLSTYSFTTVSSGTPMTLAIVNQAISAISAISGHGTIPTASNAISAYFWQGLESALNAVS